MSRIAVVGVQESVGREILSLIEEDGIKAGDVVALEAKSPMGSQVSYGEEDELDVLNLDDFDFSQVNAAIFAGSEEISRRYIPKAVAKGVKVIDCSTAHFGDSDVPMIVAGINDDNLQGLKKGIVSIPSSAVTQMLMPLKGINEQYKIKRIVASTYTSVSFYGKKAMDELFSQTRKIFMNDILVDDQDIFHKQVAYNVIPQVGDFIGDETQCEWAMNAETKKVLGSDIKVHANCAIVPAFIGCGQFINVECENELDVEDVTNTMKKTKDVIVFDKHVNGGYVCLTDVQGENSVYVSRLRQDVSVENGFSFWCVADNLRVGVAKNAFEVMKKLLNKEVKQ